MKQDAMLLKGMVEATLVAHVLNDIKSYPVERMRLQIVEGIFGDKHGGRTRVSDARETVLRAKFKLPDGIEIENVRQVSVTSREELNAIGTIMDCPGPIHAGCLGENIIIAGIPHLTQLPSGTLIHFKGKERQRTAVIRVTGENLPCKGPGEEIQAAFHAGDINLHRRFVPAATGRRGVVATIYCSGFVKPGDTALVYVPAQRIYRPE